jgi:hypothetical protein
MRNLQNCSDNTRLSVFVLYIEFHDYEVTERVTHIDKQTCNEVKLVFFELRE